MDIGTLKKALDILCDARNNLSHEDYVTIWGEELGNHIWRQEGSDLLRIWRSGLTQKQADSFVRYIIHKFAKEDVNLRKKVLVAYKKYMSGSSIKAELEELLELSGEK